ncbi:HD domain-containing phosphohydrolase [Clostridium hydrogenum]|uniref:HD domain-containing phosphohydrolase n=1 Tax=Clostridium hydrogenum TaxID=2855764 RepID=UPI001F2581B2|nr:HD domain-containing phosphohydrolase [Clostridium hydrogenum]
MFLQKLKKIYPILKNKKKDSLKCNGIKIPIVYLISGFLWIYFSEFLMDKFVRDNEIYSVISTYKGCLFIVVTTILLYALIEGFLKKVSLFEEKLRFQYKKMAESEEKYKNLVNKMQQGLAIYDAVVNDENEIIDFIFVDSNENHEKIAQMEAKPSVGKSVCDIFPWMNEKLIKKYVHVVKTGEPMSYERYVKETDRFRNVMVYRPKELQLAVIVSDITERKQMESRLEYLSYHDQLTGICNRRFFEMNINLLDKEENLPLTVVMADANGLKLVNDSFGHSFGDELIKRIAEVLKKKCREGDTLIRLGGDEFIIFMPKTDSSEADQFIKNVKAAAMKEKVGSVNISISLGYKTKIDKEESIQEVLKKAEDYMYKKKLLESPSIRGKSINTIITTLHEKNKREEQHSYRVSELCERMGIAINLDDDEIIELKTVGLLHDIGKVAIEENILNKNGKLTDEEWEEIKRHTEIGYRILSTVNEMSDIAEYVLAHHERWDGLGYPRGLAGEKIPLQSRIITIIDSYDAMVSERSYREALPKEFAVKELKRNAGTQFDPQLVDVFTEKVLSAK